MEDQSPRKKQLATNNYQLMHNKYGPTNINEQFTTKQTIHIMHQSRPNKTIKKQKTNKGYTTNGIQQTINNEQHTTRNTQATHNEHQTTNTKIINTKQTSNNDQQSSKNEQQTTNTTHTTHNNQRNNQQAFNNNNQQTNKSIQQRKQSQTQHTTTKDKTRKLHTIYSTRNNATRATPTINKTTPTTNNQ